MDVVYRDIKPENLLIGTDGYLQIIDFGFAKHVPRTSRTYTLCGTPDYLAPEIVLGNGYQAAVDNWALGVLVYECVAGVSPFAAADAKSTYSNILRKDLTFPDEVEDEETKEFICALLQRSVVDRLGCGRRGDAAIAEHPWFRNHMDFAALLAGNIKAPWIPELQSDTDATHYDEYSDDESDVDEEIKAQGEETWAWLDNW
jgi:protein kinase A